MKYFDNYPPVTEEKKPHLLTEEPSIHPSCIIKDSSVGAYTALMANTWLVESSFGRLQLYGWQRADHLFRGRQILLYR